MTFLAILSLVPIFHFPIPRSRFPIPSSLFSYHPEIKPFKCMTPPSKHLGFWLAMLFLGTSKVCRKLCQMKQQRDLVFNLETLTEVLFKATADEPTLTVTSLQRPFFWRTVHTLALVYSSLQRPLSPVLKVAVVERFNCIKKHDIYKILLLHTVHLETN